MNEGVLGIGIALMVSTGLVTMTLFRQTLLGLFFMSVGGLLAIGLVKAAG